MKIKINIRINEKVFVILMLYVIIFKIRKSVYIIILVNIEKKFNLVY